MDKQPAGTLRFIIFVEDLVDPEQRLRDGTFARSVNDIFYHDTLLPIERKRLKRKLKQIVSKNSQYERYVVCQEDPNQPDAVSQDITWLFQD